jgi:hypothetical protein
MRAQDVPRVGDSGDPMYETTASAEEIAEVAALRAALPAR